MAYKQSTTASIPAPTQLKVTAEVVKALYENLEILMNNEEPVDEPCEVNKDGYCMTHGRCAWFATDRCLFITAKDALALARGESLEAIQ
jgi:hypothetical protein